MHSNVQGASQVLSYVAWAVNTSRAHLQGSATMIVQNSRQSSPFPQLQIKCDGRLIYCILSLSCVRERQRAHAERRESNVFGGPFLTLSRLTPNIHCVPNNTCRLPPREDVHNSTSIIDSESTCLISHGNPFFAFNLCLFLCILYVYATRNYQLSTKFVLSSAWGGAPRALPVRLQVPFRGSIGHPHALPFGKSWALINTTQTPSGRGLRAALPRPRWACPRAGSS